MKHLIGIFFLLLFIGFVSCSPARRMAILKKNHPELFKSDTVTKEIQTIIPGVQADSTFPDTTKQVIIQEGKLVMKYFHTDSTIILQGECKPDTVHHTETVITNTVTVQEKLPSWVWPTIGILAGLLILIILALIFRK